MSCSHEPFEYSEVPVIEGWINSDGFPVVIFTESLIPDESGGPIADHVIRWGKVTISDGEDEVVLTGGPDKAFMPPFRYYSYAMRGEAGKSYRLTADFGKLHASAECTMLPPTPIDEIKISPIEGNDSLRSGELLFYSPEDCPAYYYISIQKAGEKGRPLPAMFGTYKTTQPRTLVTMPLFLPKNKLTDDSYEAQLKVGESYIVSLCRVTGDVYEFWKSYDNAVIFGGGLMNSSTSLSGNIQGGYGIWSAQGVSSLLIEVK